MSTLEFINAIKAKEILWNWNCQGYNDKQLRQELWEDIGNQFNLPIDECKKKWKSLRSTLCRQKIKPTDKDLPPGRFNLKWKYAKDMEFLIPLIKKKSNLFVNDKQSDSSSVSSIETDLEASPLDPIQAKSKSRRKSTITGNPIPQFIEEVKQRQVLWNYNDPNFKIRELKDNAWKEIETKLGIPDENCRKKWKCLKVYLGRECAKHPDNRSSWTYFKQLDFVRPFLGQSNSQPNAEQNDLYKAPSNAVSETKNDFPEQVIGEVKKYPILWNLYNKNYKSIYKKLKTWEKIASSLESSVEEVKKKWKALRDIFARSYVKNPDENTNNWPHFRQMIFLAPFLKCRNLVKSVDRSKESDDEDSASSGESVNNENKTKKPIKEENELTNETFIEAIKKERILWDSTFNNYKNVKLRCVVWKEVADHCGLSVVDCKKKWKVLRDLFVRTYIKPVKEEDKHWKYYDQLKFLAPHLREKKEDPLGSQINPDVVKTEPKEIDLSSSEETQNDEEQNSRVSTEFNVKDFIMLVKQHEVIWNVSNQNYRSNELRLQAWEDIAEHFGLSKIDMCKKKWKALRDAFSRRYYKPIREEDKSWEYYQEMKFLVPNLKYKKGPNTTHDSSEDEEEEEEKLTEDDNLSSALEEIGRHDIESKASDTFLVEEFIDVVKQHEVLWNTNDENYRNNELRIKEWEEIAAHFSTSVEECKKKWKALRDSFVRNYFKPIKEKYKAWNYYAQLKFLGPHVKYKKGKSLVGDSEFKRRNDDSFSSALEDTPPNVLKKFTVKEFVNEIKKHTILWDLSDERCKIKKHRLQAWKEISAHFSLSSLECKRKWATLRSAFIREFAKYPDNDTWGNFKELDFLLPYLKANVSSNNELGSPETTFPLNEAKSEPKDDEVSLEANEINSDNQYMFAHPDEHWIETFIFAVKQQQILWDTTDSNYKNALKRQQAWNKIAKEFGLSIDDSKQKWKSLRGTFAFYLTDYSGVEENSKWKHYNSMTFLCPHLKVKKLGEIGYEVNNDSDSCSTNAMKSQMHETTVDEKSTIEFINTVKENQLLWNWAEEDHKDENKKEEAWEQIANKFSSSVIRCKERWLTLQNSYSQVILSHSNDRKYSWKYLEEMDFFRPFINTHIESSNYIEVSGGLSFDDIIDYSYPEQPMVSKDDDQDDALYEELFECSPSEFAQNIERNKIQKHNTDERTAVKRKKYSDTSSDDEDEEFYQNLKEKMKKLPSDVKSEAKGHIQAYLKVVAANHSS